MSRPRFVPLAGFLVAGFAALTVIGEHAFSPAERAVQAADVPTATDFRQVTIFGILASPDRKSIDPKLLQIDSQLRKLKPGHGFKLRAVESKRLAAGEPLYCDLDESLKATVRLLDAENAEGKVRIEFTLESSQKVEFTTVVTTPPNQIFFCERPSAEGETLLIGVGAR